MKEQIEELILAMDGETFDMDAIEEIAKSNGLSLTWGDSGIDDGLDTDEDEDGDMYLMYQSCDIVGNGIDIWVKFYYGDCSYEITDITINDN